MHDAARQNEVDEAMARPKKSSAPATKAILPEHFFAKVDRFARRCFGDSRINRAHESARMVASRVRLLRVVASAKYPDLADLENDWPVTKMQMLLAHERLSADLVTLRARLDRIMHRVDVAQIEVTEQNKPARQMP